jgi:uncharacterized membrane protein YjfL (UPF0719 family)
MDFILLLTGIVQIAMSLLIGILLIYLASKVLQKLISGIDEVDELKKNNIAVAILNGSITFSLILVVKNSVESAITIFSNTLRDPNAEFISFLKTALIMLLHVFVAGIVAFTVISIALLIFVRLTKELNELGEIKKNNIAVSILLGIIIISMAMLLQPGIITVLDSLIPFPPVSLIDIGK